jgi:hypothetical protein
LEKILNYKMTTHGFQLPRAWRVFASLAFLLLPIFGHAQEDEEVGTNESYDGLVVVEGSRAYVAFIDPKADFSVFKRVAILDPQVAFRSNWRRDVNRSRSRNVRPSDVERIKEDVARLFREVFVEQLEVAGYEVVNYGDEDVVVLRPAILELDITAPDLRDAGRSRTYAVNRSEATVLLELIDSVSGDIIGRAVDRRGSRGGSLAMSNNRMTNRADARREFRVWADMLVEFLNEHYVEAETETE